MFICIIWSCEKCCGTQMNVHSGKCCLPVVVIILPYPQTLFKIILMITKKSLSNCFHIWHVQWYGWSDSWEPRLIQSGYWRIPRAFLIASTFVQLHENHLISFSTSYLGCYNFVGMRYCQPFERVTCYWPLKFRDYTFGGHFDNWTRFIWLPSHPVSHIKLLVNIKSIW